MMLLNNFYQIADADFCTAQPLARVCLNPSHEIYQAHFPGQPITPGVCQIQMAMELLAYGLKAEVCLTDIKHVKFMAVITPEETPCLCCRFTKLAVDGDTCRASAMLEWEGRVFTKMSITCHVVRHHTDIQ